MADSQSNSNVFSVRIVSLDYYMAPPIPGIGICYSSFQGGKVNEVPVIRIYGSTPAGQKTCLHLHRALPYLYVPCSDLLRQPDQEGDAYLHGISIAIEKALKLRGSAGSKRQHVHSCSLVRGRKFYGYHSSDELFVKIYLYYPQDVLRAAHLLLGGAILDKALQPHESHIPFLLQFLIDYNLYGMGLLHLSKMKFRHPVPDIFSTRKANDNGLSRWQTDKTTCSSADSQAGISHDALPIWVTSRIPDGWLWQCHGEVNPSIDQDNLYVKRQSTCELEGDAAIDDILNQQFKMYSSLSQTHSDVKMVQSLIPIWEEEYERTGLREAVIPLCPEKPLRDDVLKTLAHGLEFANKLDETCSNSENLSTQLENGSHCEGDKDAKPSEGRNARPEQLSADELQVSDINGLSNVKGADQEALSLLKWLASSQAEEDIRSDDELVLNPLLPATTIGKVMEKANMDYENEFQQEHDDILDSVEELMNFESSEERVSHTIDDKDTFQTLSNQKIPQVDGCSDDQPSIPCAAKSVDVDMDCDCEKSCHDGEHYDTGSSLSSKHKRRRALWGYSPVSSAPNMGHSLKPISFNTTEGCGSGNETLQTCFGPGKEADGSLDDVTGDGNRNACYSKKTNTIVGCSVRDLMRRKRCYRVEPPECDNKNVCSEKDLERDQFKGKDSKSLGSPISRHSCADYHTVIKMPSAASAVEVYDEACEVEHTNSSFSASGKLPLFCDFSLPSNASAGGCFYSCERVDTEVVAGTIAGYGNLNDAGSCRVQTGTTELPQMPSSSSEKLAVCMKHHESYAGKSDPHVQVPLSDTNIKPTDEVLLVEDAVSSSFLSTHLAENKGSDKQKDGSTCKSVYKARTATQVPEISSENFKGKDVANDRSLMQSENFVSRSHGRATGLSDHGASVSRILNMEADPAQLIGMNFHEKPPTVVWTDGASGHASCSSYTAACPHVCENAEIFYRPSVQDRVLKQRLPFIVGESLEENTDQNMSSRSCRSNQPPKTARGFPIHCQNDGSSLNMLTPTFLPPSPVSVRKWILLDKTERLRKNVETSAEPSSPEGSTFNSVDSLGSQEDVIEPMLSSGSMSDVNHHLIQTNQQNQGNHDVGMQCFQNDVKTVQQTERCILEVNQSGGCSLDLSQISGPDGKSKLTPLSQIGFRDPASVGGGQQLTLSSIEVQTESRGDLRPDPRHDAINVVVIVIQEDDDPTFEAYVLLRYCTESTQRNLDGISGCKIMVFSEEKDLFNHFVNIICSLDPDVLMGWDIQGGSLGFLAERAAYLGIGLLNNLSRTPSEIAVACKVSDDLQGELLQDVLPESSRADSVLKNAIIEDEWGRTHASGVHVAGRIVLNIWRLMRNEVKLNMYTVEAVAEAVLRRKIPSIHWKVLKKWFSSGPGGARYRCIEYVLERAKLNLQIMNQLDMINRTSELARVFGIDFFSVLSRGSQYRVESMFLRLAHTQNYIAISPGNQQVASQPAMECLPLVMEPESGFYADPVVVLDFQSLYPSIIIAYNLCFCTCLGNVTPSKANTLGVSSYSPDINVLRGLKNEILLTPNGTMYVPPKIRKGVLPRLLEEILSTRIMVKQAMKTLAPSQQVLHRIFNARQLALKLIANVTYGYTAAGFSGRMPCAELADSIVQCARRTLENAISFVNSHDQWQAEVIYGDTDSMFVLLKGRSVEEAFKIGHAIASAVTAMNPDPIILKMEKVYYPCFLLTKKRYVGYSYESPDQMKPMFDAKGIETVRRDTCGAVSKTMEQSLRLFFEHQDINKVKEYLLRQWTRILSGRVSLQDFVFAKEVRLGTYSTRSSSLPPAAIVATKAMRVDPRAEPRYAERVPYVVVHGEPGARLIDMVVDPLELLAIDSPLRLNDSYYITKQIIPALQRVFGLVGADLYRWFSDMPRPVQESVSHHYSSVSNPHRTRIDYYYISKRCILCGELVQASAHLCAKCSQNEATVAMAITGRTSKVERDIQHLAAICQHCGGGDWYIEEGVRCTSLTCSVFYERRKVEKEFQFLSFVAAEGGLYPRCSTEWF